MKKIVIQLEEANGVARINEPVGLGIPLPKGTVHTVHNLTLMDDQKPLRLQLEPLAHWPDGSIRWVHASFLISIDPNSKKDLTLSQEQAPHSSTPEPAITQTAQSQAINTPTGSVALQPGSLAWQVYNNGNAAIPFVVSLSDETGVPCTAKTETSWEITREGSVFVAATLKGEWLEQNNEPLAQFECELRIFLETDIVQVKLLTHNPNRARHPGGLWDLGDPGSVYFQELAVETTLPARNKAKVTPQATDESTGTFHLSDFNLYQDSSGGDNWQGRNHIDASGEVSTQFCGYRLTGQNELRQDGRRANPLVSVKHDCGHLDVTVPGFWQNFPTSLRKEGNKLTIGLFPQDAKNAYELQGGERKMLRCSIAHHSNNSIAATAYTPLVPVLAPECYERANAFPWFKANTQPGALDELIAEGVDGRSNFFAKREIIDEFGWRNFGDIFADHETLYQNEGEAPLISHYNNQYDAIYGFARQYALTGDKRWFQLMDDLARHIVDIDIYHTAEDRAEYNNGLFWHTDHYLDARTATHRTFTRHSATSSTPGQTGGGPASEHCYTTGLLYHHYMTGAPASREAVLALASWIRISYEGQGGLLEQLLALKKHDLPKLMALLKGQHPPPHRYPFTRGTGNYLNALLDASLLEPDKDWLEHAESVIRRTIHPADNIQKRNLLEVETGWSYLILMTSIARYLYLKRDAGNTDANYSYAKAAFMHYANWMLKNERPFLSDPGQLEFPNDTWVAQDVRKAMLMFQASELDPARAKAFQEKGNHWLAELCENLAQSKEKHYARILIILMQNYGPQQVSLHEGLIELTDSPTSADYGTSPRLTWGVLAARIVGRLVRGIRAFRPARERAWLNTRLDRP